MPHEFLDLCRKRKSIRFFAQKAVEPEKLERILEAGRLAPSARNQQPWVLYVVTNNDVKKAMFPRIYQRYIATAPVVIVACSDTTLEWPHCSDKQPHHGIDIAICVEHMHLAAADEGLGSCWVCSFRADEIKASLNMPDHLVPIAALPIGYPKLSLGIRKRKEQDQIVRWIP